MNQPDKTAQAGRARALVSILTAFLALAAMQPALADEADAKRLFKAMADYVENQQTLVFDYDDVLEVVTDEGQKLQIAASGTVHVKRPDKISTTRHGGFADALLTFDGTTLTLLGKNVNRYAQLEIPGNIDHLIDELRFKYDHPLPAADLLLSDVYEAMMADVTDIKDLGAGVVGGVSCDSLAFRTGEIDWQIWIAQGDHPYPCRFVITSRSMEGAPQYSIQLRNWKSAVELPDSTFAFTNLSNAGQIELVELEIVLPENFKQGE